MPDDICVINITLKYNKLIYVLWGWRGLIKQDHAQFAHIAIIVDVLKVCLWGCFELMTLTGSVHVLIYWNYQIATENTGT